jgi:hypothetical protein
LHKKYVESATESGEYKNLSAWEKLPETFKISTYHQAFHAARILREYGLQIRECASMHTGPIEDLAVELGEKGIDRLAEMEHGRWNVERLMQGWRYGPVKNIAAKVNPCLVPWSRLSDGADGVKKYDRAPFTLLPRLLKEAGLGIYRIATAGK